MFTGIITSIGKIKKIENDKKFILTIQTPKDFLRTVKNGSSVAVDGVCLTVMKITKDGLLFELMPETVRLTIANNYAVDTVVNLEGAMRIKDELGGHFVSGHVDGVGKVINIKTKKAATILTIQPPKNLLKYLAHKGSVTVNGVSLTLINPKLKSSSFQVSLVSYTLEHTNLSKLKKDNLVNLEVDLLVRYLERLVI